MTSEEVKERLRKVLSIKGITAHSLAERKTAENSRYTNQLNGERDLKVETLLVVIERMPDLDLNWLLRGKGEEPFPSIKSKIDESNRLIAEAREALERSQAATRRLQEENNNLV